MDQAKLVIVHACSVVSTYRPVYINVSLRYGFRNSSLQLQCFSHTIYPCDSLQTYGVIFCFCYSSCIQACRNCVLEDIWLGNFNVRRMWPNTGGIQCNCHLGGAHSIKPSVLLFCFPPHPEVIWLNRQSPSSSKAGLPMPVVRGRKDPVLEAEGGLRYRREGLLNEERPQQHGTTPSQ